MDLRNERGELILTDLEETALRGHDVDKVTGVVWKRVQPRMGYREVYRRLMEIRRRWIREEEGC